MLLGTTALSAGMVLAGAAAASETAGQPPAPRAERSAKLFKTAKPALPKDVAAALNASVRQGKYGLIGRVFESTYADPALRDAVLDHARLLGPGLTRDLTTAADLGVLTSGHDLTLSPRGLAAFRARMAEASAAPAAAAEAAPRAFAPPTMPPSGDQTWHLNMIGAQTAYSRGYTGAGVTVAVGDSGFDITHQSFQQATGNGTLDLARAYSNMVVQGETYDPNYVDIQRAGDVHGTHVAGLIAARKDPSLADFHGVAYDARVVPIRMIFDPYIARNRLASYVVSSPIADGIDYFTSLANVKVMNASFGPAFDPIPQQTVWPLEVRSSLDEAAAVYRALAADKIIVVANGNDYEEHPTAARNPSGIALFPFIRPEHAHTGVYDDFGAGLNFSSLLDQPGQIIAVTAVGRDKMVATYSNFCGVTASWCVAAPGGDVSGGANGGVFSTIPRSQYDFLDGTSMATPVTTGALAVLIDAYPGYSARDLARVLFSTTEDLGSPGLDVVYGHGLIRLDRATDGPTALAAGHTETVAADTTTYWSQPLTTAGSFTKAGDGILTIAGRTTAPGDVTATQGTLAIDGTLSVIGAGHALRINPGSTLAGFGEIIGDTVVAGTLSPGKMANVQDLIASDVISSPAEVVGNSAGMLAFNGNVTLTGTATTRVEIDGTLLVPGGPGTFSRILVSGAGHTFTASGTLTPVLRGTVGTPSHYTPAIGTNLTFVEAVDGARTAGAFAALTQPTDGLPANGRFDLIYAPTAITLAVTPASFAALGDGAPLTSNQQSIAAILDKNRPAAGTLPTIGKALYDALYTLNSAQDYGTALTQLSGPGQPANNAAGLTPFTGFMDSIGDRQNALVLGAAGSQSGSGQSVAFAYADRSVSVEARQAEAAFASLTPVSPQDGWGVWGQAFGRWSTVGDSGALAGSKSRSGGFALGADRLIASDLIAGAALGFARTTSDAAGSTATFDTYTGALYASWTPGRAVVDLRAAIGPSEMRTTRTIILTPGAITGKARGFGGGISGEAGYLIPFAAATLKPFVGLSWQGLRRDGYSETQQPFGLTYPSQWYEKLTTTVGLALSTQQRLGGGATLMPEFKLAWGHDLRDTTLVSEAALLDNAFTVAGASPGRDAALVGFKLAGWTQENFRLFAAYNGEFRSNATSHQLTGGVRYTW